MAYTNRTIRLNFDGTDETLPNLGDDIWVVINNPMLMPASKLRPKTDVVVNADGTVADQDAAMLGAQEIVAGLIVDWNVYDPNDSSDTPTPIELPATVEKIAMLPLVITNKISEIMSKALNPQ